MKLINCLEIGKIYKYNKDLFAIYLGCDENAARFSSEHERKALEILGRPTHGTCYKFYSQGFIVRKGWRFIALDAEYVEMLVSDINLL